MKKAKAKLYIRIGEIPEDGESKVHRSDDVLRNEGGVSVWRAVECNCRYYPILPKHPNGNTIADYFSHLLDSDQPVYLVTGTEIFVEGADREPLLMDVHILKDITHYYRRDKNKKLEELLLMKHEEKLIKAGLLDKEDLEKWKEVNLLQSLEA